MNVIHLIVAELKAIVAKPHNIVVMVAVMCVPLLYAGMFLYGFWDAFGKTGNLPVAVVNQDNGAVISGKQLNAGADLVEKLKKNNDFDWQFVSAKQAEDGFKNNHYFMTVRIPATFSLNATTLADNQLKPANLHYRINADYNFIASRMADAGVKQLKTRVSNEITKTYAKSMYAQLDKLTDGLSDAAKGSNKLAKGSKKEVAGLKTLKNGFKTLMNGTSQLSDGSAKLADGADALSDGAQNLSDGVHKYTGAVSNQIVPGSTQLAFGLNQLNNGIQKQKLGSNINTLNNGMQEFYSIIEGLPNQINSSINPAAIGQEAKQQITGNKSTIEKSAQQQISSNQSEIENSANQQITGSKTTIENSALQQVSNNKKSIENAAKQQISDQQTAIESGALKALNDQGVDIDKELSNQLEPLVESIVVAVNPSLNGNEAAIKGITDKILENGQTKNSLNSLSQSFTDAIKKTAVGTAQQIAPNVAYDTAQQIASQTAYSTAQQIAPNVAFSTAQQIAPQTAYSTAQQVAQQTASSTAAQIKSGVVGSMQQKDPKTGQTLTSAARHLTDGTSQLAGNNGIPLIISSVNQATQGAQTLNSGLNQLNNNSGSLANGASTLAGSTGTLANGAQSLASGANQLTSGTKQLSDGTNKLSDGAQQIYSGNTKLGTSLSDAHSELAKTPTNSAHATKFAEPVTSIDSSNQSVDTFGSGFAPYFISLGLYVGALLLTIIYDLGKPAGLATSGWNIALSKFFITILMSVGQALLIDFVVLKGLGLQVDHTWTFVGFTILTSMSYMAIIQWLAGSFNNEGRFAAIVILIFQLVTSGGAYAIELIPKWLQSASHVLPMTYSVNGLRNIIDGHQHQMLVGNSLILLLFIIVALSLSMITFSIKFRHTHKMIKANNYEGTPVE
ncbi:YhgE/Pip domain-containing protein [Sporolactobacillus nakayamae]|uniref:Putative membrane protein n=1 Tax=Sporolactobacillus nakayamae TaxID=269670 RepID=A0A1I2TVK7_9BACL|nr:YhgE/Pip domain-containing protein [Sporolactobacillus nakayamae]SFG68793.1 putative membrane protein [Sporolactobacillus nakayamae]